jgi:hypothetical protein
MSKDTIFENQTKKMPDWWEKPARTALDASETLNLAKLPGSFKVPGRNVENIVRPRKGHAY